jgi:hypothetical protein
MSFVHFLRKIGCCLGLHDWREVDRQEVSSETHAFYYRDVGEPPAGMTKYTEYSGMV